MTSKDLNFDKKLKLSENLLKKLINALLKSYRKRQPKNFNYHIFIRYFYDDEGKLQRKNLGYIQDKIHLKNIQEFFWKSLLVQENYDKKNLLEIIEFQFKRYFMGEISKNSISKELFEKIKTLHNWNLLFPLGNLKLYIKTFSFGNYEIIKFSRYQEKKWKDTISKYFEKEGDEKNKKFFLEWFEMTAKKTLKDRICAKVPVVAGDSKTALKKSKEELELFMSCIKYISSLWYGDYKQHRIFYRGDTYSSTSAHIGFSETAGSTGSYENNNPLPFELSTHIAKKMLKYGSNKIKEILKLSEKQRSSFQEKILEAIKLYGGAISDEEISSSYVKLTTILEFLLIKNNRESISNNLSERISFILNKAPNYREAIYKNIRNLYQIRCDIVHSGKNNVSKEDYNMLKRIVFNVILLQINCHNKFNNKPEFIEFLNRIKFGEKISFMRKQWIIGKCW